jgi:hypothetical protein
MPSLHSFLRLATVFAFSASLTFSQQSSSKAKPSHAHVDKTPAPSSSLDPGSLRDGIYRNPAFGFSYKLPITWVDRTEDMQQDSSSSPESRVLFAAFSRPPEAAGESINSAVIIAAEKASNYPGLKRAADYFEPLTAATTSKGFSVVNQPYELPVGTKLLVRSDFSREAGPQKMYQSSLAMLQKGYVVSFTIVASTEDEANSLIENLSFAGVRLPSHTR